MLNIFQNTKPISLLIIFIAIAIQIQVSLFTSEDYIGLRVNLVDLALPFLGLWIGIGILLKKTKLPEFTIKWPILWLSVLLIVLCCAFLHGYFIYQDMISWALLNKTIGFLILIAYFMLAGWIGNNITEEQLLLFLKMFLGFFCFILLAQNIDYTLFFNALTDSFFTNPYPMAGLSGNKNTYVFLFSLCLSLATLIPLKTGYQKIIFSIIWAAIPLFYIFTGARTMLILFLFLLPLLFYLASRSHKKIILLSLLIGLLSAGLFTHFKELKVGSFSHLNYEIFKNLNHIEKAESLDQITKYGGDQVRLEVLSHTINLIKENPIFGSGLGSIIRADISEKHPNMIMDSTPLWLWAETGLIGLLIFLSFYFICLRQFWLYGLKYETDETTKRLNQFGCCLMLIFAIMCLFHELLYTRFLWFFMGLILAYTAKHLPQHQTKSDDNQANPATA